MALIDCPECSTRVSDKASNCPSCGYPIAKSHLQPNPASAPSNPQTVNVAKSRGLYIVLGLLFGGLGFHNFYSGHNIPGAIKISIFLITVLMDALTGFHSAFSLVFLAAFAIWALVEIIVVTKDAKGNSFS